jgi:hypothetical protein
MGGFSIYAPSYGKNRWPVARVLPKGLLGRTPVRATICKPLLINKLTRVIFLCKLVYVVIIVV